MIRRVFIEDQVKTHHAPFSLEDIKSAVQEGRESERARIIALLEGLLERTDNIDECVGIESAIALIRGAKG